MIIASLVSAAVSLILLGPAHGVLAATELLQQPSDSVRGFAIPAVLMDGSTVGTLVLGETTIKEALRILPAWPGHGPSKLDPARVREVLESAPATVGEVLKRVNRAYNPMSSWQILHFDKDDKLVIVLSAGDDVRRPLDEMTSKYPQLREVSRSKDERRGITLVRLQADIQACVMLEVFYDPEKQPITLDSVGYLFTCDSDRSRR